VINEVLQWMVLLFLAVFVVGLTRQLGLSLVRSSQASAETQGPDVGKALPRAVLTQDERRRLQELMTERGSDWAAVLAVDERCPGCDLIIGTLEEEGVPGGPGPTIAVTRTADDAFRGRLEGVFDLVAVDPDRLKAADLSMTPFVILLDRKFRVAHKSAARSLGAAVDEWRDSQPKVVTNGAGSAAPTPTTGAEP
jgi:hypothetical protein